MSDDEAATVAEWVSVVRRARLGATTTEVALMVATYADRDGTRVFPGVARLAVQCEIGYSTARRALCHLRDVGLVEVVRRGNRRSGLADEYRLILAGGLLDRIDVPTPEQERKSILEIHERQRVYSSPASHEPGGSRGPPGAPSGLASEL